MDIVNIHEAKTHLSRLLDRVGKGGSFVIAKAGRPIARLVPLNTDVSTPHRIGFLAGQYDVPDDFDHMGAEEIEQLFRGEP